jgi:hypothetical protein
MTIIYQDQEKPGKIEELRAEYPIRISFKYIYCMKKKKKDSPELECFH